MTPPKQPKPITFDLTKGQLEQIQSYTKQGAVTLQGEFSGGKLVLQSIQVGGKFLALNRISDDPKG